MAQGKPTLRYAARGVPLAILEYNAQQDLELATHAGGEAQAAAIADDIAYDAHDIDDGLRAGLFRIEDLREVPFLATLLQEIDAPLSESRSLPPHPRADPAGHHPLRRGRGGGRGAPDLRPRAANGRGHPAGRRHHGLLLDGDDRRPMPRSSASSTPACTAIPT